MANLIGQTLLGRYRVVAAIGQGGMAEVYKVWDEQRAAYLALKLLRSDLAEDRIFLRRFGREAELLQQLQHPSIVRFYGFEQHGRLAFMLMDFIEGDTLRGRIFDAGSPLPLNEVLWWMRPICGALHYAHNLGVAHCDIKPANIMATSDGRVYLADFGIARLGEASTTTAWSPGTPAYMSPEQCRGEELDWRTDIYSLGVTLYEMVTGGERPFTGNTNATTGSVAERIRWQHFFEEPPAPSHHNPNLPPGVEALILRCMAKRREERLHGALPLLRALEAVSTGAELAPAVVAPAFQPPPAPALLPVQPQPARVAYPQHTPTPTPAPAPVAVPRRQGLVVMVGAIVLLLALVGGLMLLNRNGQPAQALLPPLTQTPLPPTATATLQPQPSPTLLPGGAYYTVQEGDSLSAIASLHDITVDALREANPLAQDPLAPGQLLVIPPAPTPTPSPTRTRGPTSTPTPTSTRAPTRTPTRTPTPTLTPTATRIPPTRTPVRTATATPRPPTPTATWTPPPPPPPTEPPPPPPPTPGPPPP